MSYEYDYIFLGNGPVVDFIANYLSNHDLKILVVTNHGKGNANFSQTSYEEFFLNKMKYRTDKVVLSLRESIETDEILRTIFETLLTKSLRFRGVIVFSSSAVYGESKEVNFENGKLSGKTEYALLKIKTERKIREITESHMILRISNLYGTTKMNGVVKDLFSRIESNTAMNLPSQSVFRDFVHVLDLTKLLQFISKKDLISGTYNFSSGKSIVLDELARTMRDCSGSNVTIERNLPSPEIIHSFISNAKLTGYYPFPFIEVRKGIAMMFDERNG